MPCSDLPHGIPAGFVLPVLVATANRNIVLRPDDTCPEIEAGCDQAFRPLMEVQTRAPNIGNITGEQCPGFAPVRPGVVLDLAYSPSARRATTLASLGLIIPPICVVFHPIRRVRY